MSVQFPPCPASLKSIQHYLKTAAEHDQRDPVISYWCRLYALQCALKIDKKSDEAKVLLVRLMDWLETQKQALADNESITNDIAAQAHIENYALKLFVYADTQDRASNFGKNVVKAFYTSGMLFDVLQTFGELTEEIMQNRKYAKWKAAYIHNCLKNGETPIPGPIQDENNPEDDELGAVGGNAVEGGAGSSNRIGFYSPPPDQPSPYMPPRSASPNEPSSPSATPGASPYFPPSGFPSTPSGGVPTDLADLNSGFSSPNIAIPGSNSYPEGSSVVLKPEQITKAQKYCKYAASALNYDDVATAVNYLEKAMKLLKTGVDA